MIFGIEGWEAGYFCGISPILLTAKSNFCAGVARVDFSIQLPAKSYLSAHAAEAPLFCTDRNAQTQQERAHHTRSSVC